ncbi:hypothetical protein Tco_1500080 [Tanacetum coccineum]
MTTLAEHIIVAGAENRPSMLDKSMYDSWASRILLFIKGKKHGRMMLDSIHNGPLVYPTIEEDRHTRLKKYSELTDAQQLQDDYDVPETNIILYGLSPDVYALVNHQEVAKDICNKVKLLMKGTKLSYQERECRLYNLFDKFASQVQVNTKFLNALLPEWSKFVIDVKLAKSFYTINYDQLYAYLSQHERHANEVCLMRERYLNPLALGNYTVGQPRVVKCYNYQGEGHMARQCTQPKRTRNSTWFKEKLMLAEAQEASQILDEVQLAFLADPRMDEAPVSHQKIPQNSAFQTKDLDAYDSDCDDISSTKADVQEMTYSEKTHLDDFLDIEINKSKENESKYIDKEVVLEKQNKEVENIICKMYRSTQAMHMLTKPHVFYNDTHKQALGYQNPFYLKKAQRIKPTLYDGSVIAKEHVVISVIDDEETLILEEESRLKILDKQNDPLSIEKKINISQINYSKLNKIKEDFGKRFVSQKELSAEQAF